MGGFDELLGRERIQNLVWELSLILPLIEYFILSALEFFVPFTVTMNRLSQYSYDWVLNLLSNVVSRTDHWGIMHLVVHALRIFIMFLAI